MSEDMAEELSVGPIDPTDPVGAVKADIDASRAELEDTVNELSNRLNPKKQVSQVAGSVGDAAKRAATEAAATAKQGAAHAQSAAKQGAAQAQNAAKRSAAQAQSVAKQGATRAQPVAGGRGRQAGVLGAVVVLIAVVLWRRRGKK